MTINIGVELEFPEVGSGRRRMLDAGVMSDRTRMDLRDQMDFGIRRGNIVYDGTVGLEAVSDVLPLDEAAHWYRQTVETIEEYGNCQYAPVSRIVDGMETSTVGTHLHISPMDRGEARDLYELSQEPDVQLLMCSRVVADEEPNYPVFRSDYCEMDEFDERHYSVLNARHNRWEWRLPEPQTMEHVENIFEFVDVFMNDGAEEALQYAKRKVGKGETTSIERAEAIGVTELGNGLDYTVERSATPKSRHFFNEVFHKRSAPYIYRVSHNDSSDEYYGFWSRNDEECEVKVSGERHTLKRGKVLDAKDLTVVEDEDIESDVVASVESYRMKDHSMPDTKAKKRLDEVL